jgi:hypothetical protein
MRDVLPDKKKDTKDGNERWRVRSYFNHCDERDHHQRAACPCSWRGLGGGHTGYSVGDGEARPRSYSGRGGNKRACSNGG